MTSLTFSPNQIMFRPGASNSYIGGYRPRKHGGIFVPKFWASLWREAGSGDAPACPITSATSRRQRGLAAFVVAQINAIPEATMTKSKSISMKIGRLHADLLTINGLIKALEAMTDDVLFKACDDNEAIHCVLTAIKQYAQNGISLIDQLNDMDWEG